MVINYKKITWSTYQFQLAVSIVRLEDTSAKRFNFLILLVMNSFITKARNFYSILLQKSYYFNYDLECPIMKIFLIRNRIPIRYLVASLYTRAV